MDGPDAPKVCCGVIQTRQVVVRAVRIFDSDPFLSSFALRPMTIRNRVFALVVAGLLAVGPVYAQQAQGTDIAGAASDVSGNLTQSDIYLFQTDEARIRMNDVAASLTQALQRGTLDESVAGSQAMSVSPAVAELFMADSKRDVRRATQAFVEAMTAQGLSRSDASTLADGVVGLLESGTVTPEQFLGAIQAFNAAVDVAPAGFLAQPPQEFIVVRSVLMALLEGAMV